uniref:Uncharacterized protein n=1 Tax=Anguilla anguilla TaxID=7936 RepID=A0A0E9XF91_ANGAN
MFGMKSMPVTNVLLVSNKLFDINQV